jgi:hypothetical protein
MKKIILTLGAVLAFGAASAQVNQSGQASGNQQLRVQQPERNLRANANGSEINTGQSNNTLGTDGSTYGAPSQNQMPAAAQSVNNGSNNSNNANNTGNGDGNGRGTSNLGSNTGNIGTGRSDLQNTGTNTDGRQ